MVKGFLFCNVFLCVVPLKGVFFGVVLPRVVLLGIVSLWGCPSVCFLLLRIEVLRFELRC